jgi:hypothetical protein
MLVVDFDERVLASIEQSFKELGLSQLLDVSCYNVFNSPPRPYVGKFDHFYANPPYGQFNQGESVWMFVHRGIEFCKSDATGSLIIPCDDRRAWTTANVFRLSQLAMQAGWKFSIGDTQPHSYLLDDDPGLQSITFSLESSRQSSQALPWQGQSVPHHEMGAFYGRQVKPPYPARIDLQGRFVFADQEQEEWAS